VSKEGKVFCFIRDAIVQN